MQDVHTRHCCFHNCKYGDPYSCTVWMGYGPQEYPCEYCGDVIHEVDKTIVDQRREEAKNSNT